MIASAGELWAVMKRRLRTASHAVQPDQSSVKSDANLPLLHRPVGIGASAALLWAADRLPVQFRSSRLAAPFRADVEASRNVEIGFLAGS